MNWGDIKDRFWEIYGGDETIYPTIAEQLPTLANMAARRLAAATGSITARATVVCSAGTQEYDLPTNCDQVMRAAYDGEKLKATTKWNLQLSHENGWDRFQGTPRQYYVGGLNEQIGLYRIPSVDTTYEATSNSETIGGAYGAIIGPSGYGAEIANSGYGAVIIDYGGETYDISGNALDIFYVGRPADIENDVDEVDLPPWAAPYVLYDILRAVYMMAYPSRDPQRAAFWGRLVQHGERRLAARAATPTPKTYVFRENDLEAPQGGWPPMYPQHIEES